MNRIDPTQRYSKVVVHGGTGYFAGLIATNWDSDISAQAQDIFAQIDALLSKIGSARADLISMTCWIKSFDDYAAFNSAYDAWIDPTALPARATVRADLLDPRIKLEIMAIARARTV